MVNIMIRFCCTVIALSLMPIANAEEPNAADTQLSQLFDKYIAEEFRLHPMYATMMGNHEHDDRLDDLSPEARAKDTERTQTLLEALDKLDKSKLSRNAQIDLEIWTHSLNYSLWREKNEKPFETDPRTYGTYISDSVFSLFTQSTLPRERNVANAAKRITYIPKIVAAAKASLSNPPQVLTEVAIKQNLGAIAFYEKGIYDFAKETAGTSSLTTPCQQAVVALKDYQSFLEQELLPRSKGNWQLGKEKFAAKLVQELDAGLNAQQVIELAEKEAVRVEREMYYVAKQLWSQQFPGVALPPDDAKGRQTTIRLVLDKLGKEHGEGATIVADARNTVEKIKTFIADKKILTLPTPDRCQVIPMPVFQRGFSVAYLNPAPPFDSKADSLYAVSPPPEEWSDARKEAFLEEYNTAMLQILTIHEAYPGHYVQLEYGNRYPSLIRKVYYSGVFAEGWAVYTEQMMLDQGYGDGDLSLRLHQLKFYLRAVLNAILDYRMHCTEFSDDDALSLLVDRGFQTEGEAVGKILRAKQSSCQLSTYFVGRSAFYNLRQGVQRQQGDKFELGPYHEAVLSHGTLPVKYLPELMGMK